MKLYYTKRSPYARKVRVMALEKQIPLEYIEEDLTNKSASLWKANPLGKIPALVLDNGETIFDSPVICEYIDTLKDKPLFIPKSGQERIHVLRWQALADGLTDVTLAAYMEKTVRHPKDFNETFVKAQEETVKRTISYIDARSEELKVLNLSSVSVAAALGYANFRTPHLIERDKNKKLFSWYDEFAKRPSMMQTIPS